MKSAAEALLEHLDMLQEHQGMTEQQINQALADPVVLNSHIEMIEKHQRLTDEEKASIRPDPTRIHKYLSWPENQNERLLEKPWAAYQVKWCNFRVNLHGL